MSEDHVTGGEDASDGVYTLGDHTFRLAAPASLAIRWEILALQGANWPRCAAAALASCWKGPGRPSASYRGHGYNTAAFGGAVLDELLGRGIGFGEIMAAGAAAVAALAVDLVSTEEVLEAEAHFPE